MKSPSTLRLGLVLSLLLAVWLVASGVQAAEPKLTVLTEELPPYNMTVDGTLTGMSTEVVRAVLDEAGVEANFQSLPWARAYDIALNTENILIYSIARTPRREGLFRWIGAVAPTQWHLFSLPGRTFDLKSLDDARRYQIATVKADVGEQYLVAHGFELGRNLQSSNRYEHNYDKLKAGRVDLWISNDLNAHYLVRQGSGNPADSAVPQLALQDLGGPDGLYMALSVRSSPALAERLRQALERVRADGRYAAIERKWL